MPSHYKLSAILQGHSADVRAVTSPNSDLVLSASRDTTAIAWSRQTSSAFSSSYTYTASSRYVNAVAYLPPSPEYPGGLVVTGGQDAIINVYALGVEKKDPIYTLLGHKENVCALNSTSSGVILSGSWDRTARVWQKFQLAFELVGHEQAVWAVLAIDDTFSLTGSADKTVKHWEGNKVSRTYRGHQDAVRGLALLPDIGFASCSNDSEIRLWTTEGDTIQILSGHTSFVYSLGVLPNGDIVSGGEDRSMRIWSGGECVQTVVHPAVSVWAVSTMPNGDIVTGCSDGAVRVFSVDESRWASTEDLKTYDDLVAKQALPSQQVGDVKKTDLPGKEALLQPGKKDGQVIMIKEGSVVEAHQWNSSNFQWQKVGEVVDAVGNSRKQLYQGKEYDYVFDVDIKDGVPPLKLPYNVTENPFQAAQRFLEANDLPLSYVDEVVKFIEQNTAGVAIGAGSDASVDPFTGASRYRSNPQSVPTTGSLSSQTGDPFTGASRYQAPTQQAQSSGSFVDPFTGNSAYSTANSAVETSSVKTLPVRKSLSFKQSNVSAMKTKLFALNKELSSDASLPLTPTETRAFDEIFTALTVAVASQSSDSVSLGLHHLEAIADVANRWPPAQCFPVIDLARLTCICAPKLLSDPAKTLSLFKALLRAAQWSESWNTPLPKHRETNALLVLRTFANAVQDSTPLSSVPWIDEILSQIQAVPFTTLNKNQRTALATFLFNVSTVVVSSGLEATLLVKLVDLVISLLNSESEDSESAYRAFVALGNMVYAANSGKYLLDPTKRSSSREVAAVISKRFPDARTQTIAKELVALLA